MASTRKPAPSKDLVGAALASALQRSGTREASVCVALSGGVDSVVLLHALRALAPKFRLQVCAMHVNHGISPNARRWEGFCRALCARLRVPLTVRRVKVKPSGQGLEAAAREARYAALAGGRVGIVVLAHQLDDQAETVLLNLLRGSGLAGASGMAESGPLHGACAAGRRALRPLLAVAREDIEAYAREHELDWVEDESNVDEMLMRNWVRRRVAPLLAARFPRWREALSRAASHFAEAQGLLGADAPAKLTTPMLSAVPAARAKLLLRGFLSARGLRAPSAQQLNEMLHQLISAPGDARVELHHDGQVLRRYRGVISVLPATLAAHSVALRKCRGSGIDAEKLKAGEVTVRLRRGGERLRLAADRPSRTLKNLFQEAGIPPWERDRLPLLYCGSDLVWVPGLGIAANYRAAKGAAGLCPVWRAAAPVKPRKQ